MENGPDKRDDEVAWPEGAKEPVAGIRSPFSEGGTRGIVIVVASFLCNGIIFGVVNSVGSIYEEIEKNLTNDGDKNAAAKACKLIDFIKTYPCRKPLKVFRSLGFYLYFGIYSTHVHVLCFDFAFAFWLAMLTPGFKSGSLIFLKKVECTYFVMTSSY